MDDEDIALEARYTASRLAELIEYIDEVERIRKHALPEADAVLTNYLGDLRAGKAHWVGSVLAVLAASRTSA